MIGIDVEIESAKDLLNSQISGLTMYGRAFRNNRNKRNIPELYLGNNEYREILFEDSQSQGFFYETANVELDVPTVGRTEIYICFAVNLNELYASITNERQDQYFIKDVLNTMTATRFKPVRLRTGREAFDIWNLERFNNMHPYYLLRVECELQYSINNNC